MSQDGCEPPTPALRAAFDFYMDRMRAQGREMPIDAIGAATKTMQMAIDQEMPCGDLPAHTDLAHLLTMLSQMDGAWPDDKLNRWLGWMQACVVCHCPDVTVDDMRRINAQCIVNTSD